MKNFICAVIICLLFCSVIWAKDIAKIIAKVNKEIITSKDLEDYCQALSLRVVEGGENISCSNEQLKKEALQRLIEDKLILQDAKREKREVSNSQIEGKLDQIISSYPSREEFEQAMTEKGLTITLLKEKIKDQYYMQDIIEEYVKSFVSVSPQEISNYYIKNQKGFISPLIYIFYVAKSKDNVLIEDIARVTKEKGVIVALKEYDNVLMKLESSKEELKPQIAEILEKLDEGKFKTEKMENMFYFIYLEKKDNPHPLALEEVKEQIYYLLWQEKFRERFRKWIGQLKEKSTIENYYE